jgi:hypothetical protein
MNNKFLLNELSRINELMGDKSILNEQGRARIGQAGINALKSIFKLEDDALKIGDNVTDAGRIAREVIDTGDQFLIKQQGEIFDALKKWEGNQATAKETALLNKAVLAVEKLTDTEISKIRQGAISDYLTKDPNMINVSSNMNNAIDEIIVSKFENNDPITLEELETIYRNAGYNLAISNGKSEKFANEIADVWLNKWRRSDKYKKLFKDGEEITTISKRVDPNNPITTSKKSTDFITKKNETTKIENRPFEDVEFFDERRVSELGYLNKFYIKQIEPYTRWWLGQLKLLWDDLFLKNVNKYIDDFNDSVKRGFDQYVLERGKVNNAYFMDIIEKFQKIPRRGNNEIPGLYNNIYNFLWDDFISNANKYFANDPQRLKNFNKFTNEILSYKSNTGKTYDMEKILGLDPFAKTEIDKGIIENLENIKKLTKWDTYKNQIQNLLVEGVIKSWNLFTSGTFRNPDEYSRYMIRQIKTNKKLTINGERVFSNVYNKKTAVKYFLARMAWSNILLPSVIAALEMSYEGWVASKTNVRLYDRDLAVKDPKSLKDYIMNYVWAYAINDIFTGIKVDDLISEETKSGWDDYLSFIPGYRDDLLIGVGKLLSYAKFGGTGDESTEEAAKKTINQIKDGSIDVKEQSKELIRKNTNKILQNETWQETYAQHDMDFKTLKYNKGTIKESNNLNDEELQRIKNSLQSLLCSETSINIQELPKPDSKYKGICMGVWTKDLNKVYKIIGNGWTYSFIDDDGKEKPIKEILSKNLADFSQKIQENYKLKINDMKNLIRKIILEQEEEKTLKMKDWNEIFSFQKVDDNESGKYTDVKIKMDSVMDRMPHWRKKYKKQCEDIGNCDDDGEDDSFVRAVIDTHPEVVRVLFTKGMANLTSSDDQEDLNESLHGLLAFLRESKNVEVEVWSVYRHPSSPDKIWSLVKGDYKPKELSSMDKKMQQSPGNSVEKKKDSLSELKKKESEAIRLLSTDEKKGLMELPIKVRNRVKEMIKKGWTTERPSDNLMSYYKEDKVDSVFEDPIKVYKLRPNQTFFNFIKSQKSDDEIKRGFCRSIYYVEKEFDLPKEVSSKIDDILNKCDNKHEGKYGQNYL